ncbi:MAG: DUF4143 domain-containing protein [Bifidobacteriaceae bacterium]|nr:DUF4143 domain-containing protein [Bifidobacteriaceae bacterium]
MNSNYVRRLIDSDLDDLMPDLPAIALEGPKGVGKTATASRRARTVLHLDRERDAEEVLANPRILATEPPPVLLDEWQHVPQVWDEVRHLVDDGARPGSFLFAGSAAPVGAATHSGAARIVRMRIRPLSLAERQLATPSVSLGRLLAGDDGPVGGEAELGHDDYIREIAASGFPALRRLSARSRHWQLEGYVTNVVEHEFADQGITVRKPHSLRRWLRAYAGATATNASYTAILDAATAGEADKPAASTVVAYRDALAALWLLDEVDPWDPGGVGVGVGVGRLAKTPRHFLADPALALVLLGLDQAALARHPEDRVFGPRYGSLAGRLFEALVGLSLQTYAARNDATVSFLRTQDGRREVDFVVQKGRAVVGVEVKLAAEVGPKDVAHLVWLRERLGSDFAAGVVLTTGRRAYRRPTDGILVIPAALLGA